MTNNTVLETAQRHQKNGEFPIAERLYRQVLVADPYNAEAAFFLATAYQAQNKPAEAFAHLERALRIRPNYAEARHARGLVFAAKGDLLEALEELRIAVQLKPDYAEAFHNLGVTLARVKRLDEAVGAFRQAIRLKPDYAEAIVNLAKACEEKGAGDQAAAAYRDLLRLRPGDAAVHNALGLVYAKQRRMPEAAQEFDKAVALDSGQAVYQNNLGAAFADLGRPADALAHFDAAVALNPEHADAHKNRAMSLLHLGDFERGWQEFEWRWRCKDFKPPTYRQPAWDGSSCAGRRILLYTEQGIGDTFQFIRYASLLAERGALVAVECPAPLAPILSTCPGVSLVVARGERLPDFDFRAALMSLPRLLGTTLATVPARVPYLAADGELVERWRRELECSRHAPRDGDRTRSGRTTLGIVWQGSSKNGKDYCRSMPLEYFAALAGVKGVQLYSLQKDRGSEQLANVIGRFPIIDLGGRLDRGMFNVTAAAMCNLDLVVSCDTSCAHLAGALGRPVWVPLSYAADWRWLREREDSPWYPTMRLFRQTKLGDWESVFARMAEALRALVSGRENADEALVSSGQGIEVTGNGKASAARILTNAATVGANVVAVEPNVISAKARVSLCMIVKNEEGNLAGCLGPVADLFHEIIVVDTGSTDGTKECARRYGAKVFDFTWVDSFAAARNESLRHATGDWIFWLDGDDRVDDVNLQKLRRLLAELPDENNVYMMCQWSAPDKMTGANLVVDQARLFRNLPKARWSYRVHEQIFVALKEQGAKEVRTDIVIHHLGYQEPEMRHGKRERNLRLLHLEKEENPKDGFIYFNLANAVMDAGRAHEALGYMQCAIEHAPKGASYLPKVYFLMAGACQLLGRADEALHHCREGKKRFPKAVDLWFQEGVLLLAKEDLSGARHAFETILELPRQGNYVGMDPELAGSRTRHNLAFIYRKLGLKNKAEEQWLLVLDKAPTFEPVWLALAELYLEQKRRPEAEALLSRLEDNPARLTIEPALQARLTLAKGDIKGARRILEEAIAQHPKALWLRILLADILMKVAGDPKAAEVELRAILALSPNEQQARQKLTQLVSRQETPKQ